MSKYCVKLDGQVLTEPLDYQTAVQITADCNAENITRFGDESIADTGLNLYEVSLSDEQGDSE